MLKADERTGRSAHPTVSCEVIRVLDCLGETVPLYMQRTRMKLEQHRFLGSHLGDLAIATLPV